MNKKENMNFYLLFTYYLLIIFIYVFFFNFDVGVQL